MDKKYNTHMDEQYKTHMAQAKQLSSVTATVTYYQVVKKEF